MPTSILSVQDMISISNSTVTNFGLEIVDTNYLIIILSHMPSSRLPNFWKLLFTNVSEARSTVASYEIDFLLVKSHSHSFSVPDFVYIGITNNLELNITYIP